MRDKPIVYTDFLIFGSEASADAFNRAIAPLLPARHAVGLGQDDLPGSTGQLWPGHVVIDPAADLSESDLERVRSWLRSPLACLVRPKTPAEFAARVDLALGRPAITPPDQGAKPPPVRRPLKAFGLSEALAG